MPTTNNRLLWYVLTTLTTIVLALTAAWGHSLTGNVSKNETNIQINERRLSELEGQFKVIDSKLDMLLRERGLSGKSTK